MRATSNSIIQYSSKEEATGPDQTTLFVEASTPRELLEGFRAALKPFADANEGGETWQVAFVDLAGAGDGKVFAYALRLFNETEGGPSGSGIEVEQDTARSELEGNGTADSRARIRR
jgi:hypothetical protein